MWQCAATGATAARALVTMTDVRPPRLAWCWRSRRSTRYYEQILADFSINDITHTLHYLLKMLENMKRLDGDEAPEPPETA